MNETFEQTVDLHYQWEQFSAQVIIDWSASEITKTALRCAFFAGAASFQNINIACGAVNRNQAHDALNGAYKTLADYFSTEVAPYVERTLGEQTKVQAEQVARELGHDPSNVIDISLVTLNRTTKPEQKPVFEDIAASIVAAVNSDGPLQGAEFSLMLKPVESHPAFISNMPPTRLAQVLLSWLSERGFISLQDRKLDS